MFERKVQASGVAGIEPQPARLSIWSHTEQGWAEERLEDPESNVFHKALPFEDGILTLSGEKGDDQTLDENKWCVACDADLVEKLGW